MSHGKTLHDRLVDTAYALAFGLFLRDWRKSHGLSQESLAKNIGIASKTVSNIETANVHPPSLDNLLGIAQALGHSDPRELQEKFEQSAFYSPNSAMQQKQYACVPQDIPPAEAEVAERLLAKWNLLPDSTRSGLILIHGGEAAYFEHFIRLVEKGISHRVYAYIQFGKGQNFLRFNMPGLYPALQKAVDEGRLVIEYIMLFESKIILNEPAVIQFIDRYKAFAERINLIFEDSPQLPDVARRHSIVLMIDAQITFLHGRDEEGKMVEPRQLISAAQFEEHAANYRKIRMASEDYFITGRKRCAE